MAFSLSLAATFSIFPWMLHFVHQTLFSYSILFSTSRARHRRDYDEQKAVAVVNHHYQGCHLNAKLLLREIISEA